MPYCPSNVTVFKRGRQTIDDDPRSGRPSEVKNEETIEKCEKIIDENRRITVEELSACLHVSVSVGSAHALIHELGFHKVSSRFVPLPRFLTAEMREDRVECCQANLKVYKKYGEAFLNNIVTVDETPLSLYIPETKKQSMEWKRNGLLKGHLGKSSLQQSTEKNSC